MPIITIGDEYRIKSTTHSWELQIRIPRNNKDDEWRHKGSYSTIESAVNGCREAFIRESDKDSYMDALNEAESLISRSLKSQNILLDDI